MTILKKSDSNITNPQISVVTPLYNRREFVEEMVQSILQQKFDSWELIIVDDGSTDGSEKYIKTLSHPKIKCYFRSDITRIKGSQACRNIGIRKAMGKYIIFLDCDDVLLPECLKNRFAFMERHSNLDFAVFWAVRFKNNISESNLSIWGKETVSGNELDDFLQNKILWQTAGPIWRKKSILEKQGFWDEELVVGHDHEYHVRALCKGLLHVNTGVVDFGWRIPDRLSLSSFDSFKLAYRNGSFIFTFGKIVDLLKKYNLATPHRKKIIKKEAIRLAMQVRLNNGKFIHVNKALSIARKAEALNAAEAIELKVIFHLWVKIFGKIPSLSYLHRRYSI